MERKLIKKGDKAPNLSPIDNDSMDGIDNKDLIGYIDKLKVRFFHGELTLRFRNGEIRILELKETMVSLRPDSE